MCGMITLLFKKAAVISHQVSDFIYYLNETIIITDKDGLNASRTAVHSGNHSAVSSA